MFAAPALREYNSHIYTHIIIRSLPYRADQSAQYGKVRLYCMRMHSIIIESVDSISRDGPDVP